MAARSKILDMGFAWVSPVFVSRGFRARVSGVCLAAALLSLASVPSFSAEAAGPGAANNSDTKRQAATAQLERAEEQRQTLNEKPANKRSLAE